MQAYFYSVLIFLVFTTKDCNSQSFLNGDFEFNSANGCQGNISNSQFNFFMDSVNGIGQQQTLDIFEVSCSFAAANGQYFSSLETNIDTAISSAISFLISDSLIPFDQYIISFYDKNLLPWFQPVQVEVGYSSNDSTFGTLVYSSPSLVNDTGWTKHFVFFTPSINTKYITARGKTGVVDFGIFVDNFSFDTTGLYLAIEKEQPISFSVYPNPCKEELHVQLQGYVAKAREIKIYSVLGDPILSKKIIGAVNTSEVVLDVHELSSGVYFAVLESEGGRVVRKIIKE